MQLSIRPKASRWRPGSLRLVMIVMVGITICCAQPASAGPDYGFVEDQPTTSRGKLQDPQQLLHTRAIAIPTNRFRGKWDGLLKSLKETRSAFNVCSDANSACNGPAN